ncbi:hypothetical protein HBH56_131410 [Parastagonospora nodorum]|uniref:Uncharacterized protein n=1 Tax=Phaeosphaeria nodorum (strain SN15 / ATCC MYA-4574 / FGSC 10173) TaxID=321614 RepID=A0A7U2FCR3_PHANO|nr:hypothetical protein HBH56_131410 [Parastagonospora nodorum]QRD02897.1 hypothetical protein JI435_418810 [Parastagonospora nodorum SN15]KAH3937990.1 hypothetical protein HBH54_007280 [Parastagonospora nodorum]KAH4144180.1 hypothetical protein HBH45_027580 [Parastagonospora nodorum]KAH4159100.1 hypothetical protein HBH44_113240 [Parastagonospora nodorum]
MAFNFFLQFGTTASVLPLSRSHPYYFNKPTRSGFAEPLFPLRLHHSNLYHGKHTLFSCIVGSFWSIIQNITPALPCWRYWCQRCSLVSNPWWP